MKRVLVTGASRGIGRAVALRLAQEGFTVTLHYSRSKDLAEGLFEELKQIDDCSRLIAFDVCDREAVRSKLAEEVENVGAFYGIVANAGITRDTLFPAMKEEDWDSVIDTNLNSFFNVVQPLIMPMVRLRSRGRIIGISSLAGLVGNAGQVNYSAAKAGLIGACRSLAQELAGKGITVNCVAPGLIETDMTKGLPKDEILKHIPMKRFGTVEEVAGCVSYLMSDEAGYITGQTISLNGGML